MSSCVSVCLSVCLSDLVYLCLSACLPASLPLCLPACLPIYLVTPLTRENFSCGTQLSNIAFIKTHKTASTTLASILYRYGMRHGSKMAKFNKGGTYVDLDVAAKQVRRHHFVRPLTQPPAVEAESHRTESHRTEISLHHCTQSNRVASRRTQSHCAESRRAESRRAKYHRTEISLQSL